MDCHIVSNKVELYGYTDSNMTVLRYISLIFKNESVFLAMLAALVLTEVCQQLLGRLS